MYIFLYVHCKPLSIDNSNRLVQEQASAEKPQEDENTSSTLDVIEDYIPHCVPKIC